MKDGKATRIHEMLSEAWKWKERREWKSKFEIQLYWENRVWRMKDNRKSERKR
jgi:hypothetical protein